MSDTERKLLLWIERIARNMPRMTPKAGHADTMHDVQIMAADIWENDRALKALDAYRAASADALHDCPTKGDAQ